MPRHKARHVARILTCTNTLGQEGIRHNAAPQHPTRHLGEARGEALVILQRADIAIVGERQGALIRHGFEGIQVNSAFIHLLSGSRMDAKFAQGELLDQRQPLKQKLVILQPKAHLDGEVTLAQNLAARFQHTRQHAFIAQQPRTAPLLCHKGPWATRIQVHLTITQFHHRVQHHTQLTRIFTDNLRN